MLQEDDERFELSVELTKSERYIILTSTSQVTSESRFLRSDDPTASRAWSKPRRDDIEYSVDHQEDRFLILTNDGATQLQADGGADRRARAAPPGPRSCRSARACGSTSPTCTGTTSCSASAPTGCSVSRCSTARRGELHVVEQPDAAYTAFPGSNPDYDSRVMRFFYTSLTAPWSAVDYDMDTRERTVVKEQPVRGGYDRDDYVTERLWATSPDGVQVPMSIVYRRGLQRDGSHPAAALRLRRLRAARATRCSTPPA